MSAVLICREQKWTIQEYRAQPQWFIAYLFSMLQEEAEEQKRRQSAK